MSASNENIKLWSEFSKKRIVEAMGGCCVICKYNHCYDSLEFHHLDSSLKKFGIAQKRITKNFWENIVSELKKCVLLCGKCHRELHAGFIKLPDDYYKFNLLFEDYDYMISTSTNKCPVCDKKVNWSVYCSKICSGKDSNAINRSIPGRKPKYFEKSC